MNSFWQNMDDQNERFEQHMMKGKNKSLKQEHSLHE
jgi:hypothetical protein